MLLSRVAQDVFVRSSLFSEEQEVFGQIRHWSTTQNIIETWICAGDSSVACKYIAAEFQLRLVC